MSSPMYTSFGHGDAIGAVFSAAFVLVLVEMVAVVVPCSFGPRVVERLVIDEDEDVLPKTSFEPHGGCFEGFLVEEGGFCMKLAGEWVNNRLCSVFGCGCCWWPIACDWYLD